MSKSRVAKGHLESLPTGVDAPASGRRRELAGWGQHPVIRGVERRSEDLLEISRDAILSRGLGRSYGDAALPPEDAAAHVATTTLADRLLAFDPETGVLRAEAGVSLATLNSVFLPRGWISPVTPGTAQVTLGGMVASDVHNKNHHSVGCFGEHVLALRMCVADGRVVEVSERSEPDLFHATLGGMGLTGHVLEVELRMTPVPSRWIWCESERLGSIDALLPRLVEAGESWPSTVAWLDCTARGRSLGRGILMKGRWATAAEAPDHPPPSPLRLSIPLRFPNGLVNRHTLRLANSFWYWKHGSRASVGLTSPDAWFHQLDGISHWHRVYGSKGFTQYQCVIPGEVDAYRELLSLFQRGGGSSFVTVLKDCGARGRGLLSFPQPGVSLALDVPIRGDETRRLVSELNEFVVARGGRIYLAKDAFTTADQFRRMYPRLAEFEAVRRVWDPEGRLQSAQSRRLGIR